MSNYSTEFLNQEVHLAAGYKECKNCNGSGIVWYPNGPNDADKEICDCCNGLGLIK